MAKFCGKCGARLDDSGYCPNCDGGYRKAAAPNQNTPPAAPVSRKEQRKLRKQAKRDAKKEAKRARRAAMTTGQKVGRFFLKLLGILLALAVLVAAAVCALVYFEIVDIPVVDNLLETVGVKENADIEKDVPDTDMSGLSYYPTAEENIVQDKETGVTYINNELIVSLTSSSSKSQLETKLREIGGQIVGGIDDMAVYQLQFSDTYTFGEIEKVVETLEKEQYVQYAAPNVAVKMEPSYIPNDEKWKNQWGDVVGGENWGVEAIDAVGAWDYRDVMQAVNVGIMDAGFDVQHADLNFAEAPLGNATYLNKVESGEREWTDHGTHVAGTIAAGFDNKIGITGIAPKVNLYGVAIWGITGSGYSSAYSWNVGLAYLIQKKQCSVINISLASYGTTFNASRKCSAAEKDLDEFADEVSRFLQKMIDKGYNFVICKGAGNQNDNGYQYFRKDDDDTENQYDFLSYNDYIDYLDKGKGGEETRKIYGRYLNRREEIAGRIDFGNVPSEFDVLGRIKTKAVKDRIIVVGAIKDLGTHQEGGYIFGLIGSKTVHDGYEIAGFSQCGKRTDVLAPGVNIYSTIKTGDGYGLKGGTSMATPHAAGVAALIFAVKPDIPGEQVKKIIKDTSVGEYRDGENSYGLLNAKAAVEAALAYEKEPDKTTNTADIPTDAVEFNGHRYYLYDFAGLAEPTQNTWENAQAYCEAVGGYLATITTPEENDFLYRYMRQRGYASAYFGLSNTQTGAWQWGNDELLTYTNWHSGEPNNQNGNEHYGMFYVNFSDGTWNDGKFDAPYTEPQQERQDIVSTVTASSYLPIGSTASYEPANVLDGDLATAWAEGKGAGETISFTFDDSYRIGGIVINVGYQKSDELYGANSRPAEIRVTGDNGFEQLCSVQDLNGRQEVVFNQFANTRSLSVTIENIYEGSDCSDTCISEIAFLVGGGVSGSSDGGTAFLCEWGEPAETGDTPDNGSQMQPETSGERSIALVLDTSGSMSGTPIEETRKAASNFVFSVLPENAAVGVVTYMEYAQVRTDFTMDFSKLEEIVSNLSADGGTNIDDGLKQAYNMLQRTSSKKKIIILMSDGEPNNGRTGDELIAFADEIKQSGVYIYTLGFFDALGDRTQAQYLMERLASDGCHYEVSSAEDLVFFFGDIASQINGQKYIYIRIACPVDVTVSYGGETLTSAEDALNTRTDFGTLTFEDSEKTSDTAQTDQVKILRLKEGVDYDVKITGTGYGMMDYTIGFMDDDGQYSDLRYFEDIRITRNTMIEATAAVSDQSVLKVDTDGDGRFDLAYRAGQNEHAQQTKVIPWLTVALVAAGVVVLAVVLVVVLQKNKKRKVR